MSGNALRDLNSLPGIERKNEGSSKGSLTKPDVNISNENNEDYIKKSFSPLVSSITNGVETIANGVETASSEVEYIESENLTDVEDLDTTLKTLLTGLDSKNWVLACEALNNVRKLSLYDKDAMLEMLTEVISLVVKSLKNPRSAVCKTAVMTSADIFSAYGDDVIDSLEPLLVQLLLKSSQDKRFVCEVAEKALIAMTTWMSPFLLLPKLLPHLKHRNPRIRAKASMCFCRSVPRLGVDGIKTYGIDKLIQIAASQLSDQLPESREAARSLLLELQSVYHKCNVPASSEAPPMDSWEEFCQSNLSPLNAQAVLRVTSVAREAVILGS